MSWLNGGVKCDPPARGDYEDDCLDATITRSYQLKLDSESYNGLRLLIVTTSQLSADFIRVYLSPNEIDANVSEAGQIIESEELENQEWHTDNNHSNGDLKQRTVAKLFKISDSVAHCHVCEQLSDDDINKFTQELTKLDTQQASSNFAIVILSSYNSASYQFDTDYPDLESPLQRYLLSPSSQQGLKPTCKRLEQPNTIKGLGASVLIDRTFNSKPCLLLLNYTDSQKPDSITLGGFSSIFSTTHLKNLIKPIPIQMSVQRLKKLQRSTYANENIFT